MANNPSEKGYGDGKAGKPADNPHKSEGVLSRAFDITADVISGNAGNITQTNDKNAKAYDDAHKAGEADRKSGK